MAQSIILRGCTPEPMAAYLKALAVLRLVSEQADPEARAWWRRDVFWLESSLDEDGLARFFLDRYSPTPIVGPWNGGSGFSEGVQKDGLEAILASETERFREYRETIKLVRSLPEMPAEGLSVGEMLRRIENAAAKAKGKKRDELIKLLDEARTELPEALDEAILRSTLDDLKAALRPVKKLRKLRTRVNSLNRAAHKGGLIPACRSQLCDRAVDWMDAAVVSAGKGKPYTPPILGSGGNDGHLDFTNAFMDLVSELLLRPSGGNSEGLLRNALFGQATDGLEISKFGQYDPGRAGGSNQGSGTEAIEAEDVPVNPWNFVLTMEGTAAWASGISRRHGVGAARSASSPFTVQSKSLGFASASDADDETARDEIWMPIWERATRYEELRWLLREGRADIGRKQASDGLQFAEAAVSLGVDRGITSFVRFSLLRRRGKSYLALPTARFQVCERREADLLEELDPMLAQIDHFGEEIKRVTKAKALPARFGACRRGIDNAVYKFLLQGGAIRFKDLMVAFGRMEQYFAERDPAKQPRLSGPLSGLSPRWLAPLDDGSVEVRIAAALASIGPMGRVGPIRAGLSSIDPEKPWEWAEGNGQKAWRGATFAERLTGLLQRRMMDAERLECDTRPLHGYIEVHPQDIAAFLDGSVNDRLIEDLLFGMTWIEWWKADVELVDLRSRWREPVSQCAILRSWALLKQLFRNDEVRRKADETESQGCEPAIIPLLRAQRVGDACWLAARRLHSEGLRPTRAAFPDGEDGLRLAASLLIPSQKLREISKLVMEEEQESGA